ncbi:MAG: GNAT family N-acetyltransferase, partial [Bacteroidaceae bacterium]|nr:GNAT family N-acetyltransferase [Bacteroidaceae bacterium]
FLFDRRYMDYHADRFCDHSLLFYRGETLLAVLPAHLDSDTLCSHRGLTYGGLLTAANRHATDVIQMLDEVCNYYRTKSCKRLIYKAVPHIYSTTPCEADLYWLTQRGGSIVRRALSTAINLEAPLPFSTLRRRRVKKAQKNCVTVARSSDFKGFWGILEENLSRRFGVKPVHTLEEITLLQSCFPTEILLFTATASGNVVAGVVVFASRGVAHAQYIAANEYGKEIGALDLVFSTIVSDCQAAGYKWLDFGISTDHSGAHLNEGLLMQKEGFGGRSVCYDTYLLNL